ncbi:MAG: DUF4388 domain-containing protein [Candidatus Zixiibacteriota bacterium]|nr:MAG: DUF4388 domain-containing protein [candidate division Zixibacteria bacterium]
MSLSGNLKTVAFPDILQLLATGKKTGILECKTTTRQKEVSFKEGNIIFASSVNSTEDLLGQMLLKRGKISKADLERAITLHKQTGRQLGTTLIDMNLFEKEDIAECLKLQIEEIVYNLFSWKEGDFIFHESETPKNAPFLIELNTMNVIMEGTRRIDEWMEIQKVVPPDDVMLRIAPSPKVQREDITMSLEEFRLLSLINSERTVSELIDLSSMGEFVTCRSIYRLILANLVEAAGQRERETSESEDEEEIIISIIFSLYSACFHKIRSVVAEVVGDGNTKFSEFAAQYRSGLMSYFPGHDPNSDLMPSLERFLSAFRSIPLATRYHSLMSGLDQMLSDQLVYVFRLLGQSVYRDVVTNVKKEISTPLATRRELVKRYGLENGFYGAVKHAEKIVRLVRG